MNSQKFTDNLHLCMLILRLHRLYLKQSYGLLYGAFYHFCSLTARKKIFNGLEGQEEELMMTELFLWWTIPQRYIPINTKNKPFWFWGDFIKIVDSPSLQRGQEKQLGWWLNVSKYCPFGQCSQMVSEFSVHVTFRRVPTININMSEPAVVSKLN